MADHAPVDELIDNLKKLTAYLDKANLYFAKIATEVTRNDRDVPEMARVYCALYDLAAVAEKSIEPMLAAKATMKEVVIPETFDKVDTKTLTLTDGARLTTSAKLYASIIKAKQPEAFAWLRKHKLGALIVQTVNATTLSAAAQAMKDTENRELPEDLFSTHIKRNTSLTRPKVK